jgi:hypothetical protein
MKNMKTKILFLSLIITLNLTAQDDLSFENRLLPVSESNFLRSKDYFIWDTSILKDKDGKYHLFYSRWKKEYGFQGWLLLSEIVHAESDSPIGPWKDKGVVLKGRGNGYWDAITAHNPMINYFNGKYYLYYNSTNLGNKKYSKKDLIEIAQNSTKHPDWKVVRNNQRVGVAVSNSLKGPWTRMDKPLVEPSGPISTFTNNPTIAEKDGKYFLIVKGDKPNEKRFVRNQAMTISDSPTGPFVMQEKAVIDYLDTEDMCMWYDSKRNIFYSVFHTNGFIGMVCSEDGLNWHNAKGFVVTPKKIKMKDGSMFIPNRLERPFVYVENNEPRVLALAAKKGDESMLVFIEIKQ